MGQHKKDNTYHDAYEQVTNFVIESLKKGVVVWRKPWATRGPDGNVNFPKNLTTQKQYRGWNVFWLSWHMRVNNFTSPYFLTFKQAQALGGYIRKGSHGMSIVKWVTQESKTMVTDAGVIDDKPKSRVFPVTHTVFNVEQTEKIDYPICQPIVLNHNEKIEACEKIVVEMPEPPLIKTGGNRAAYSPTFDRIVMPEMDSFINSEEYYSTLFHELVHSTGHEKRLNRKELKDSRQFGDDNYSKEELTAELGSAYLCGMAGVQQKTIQNSIAYISGWLGALQNDKKLIIRAASQAQHAADFILNAKEEKTADVEDIQGVHH